MNMSLGWLIGKLLLGCVGLYTSLFALNPTEAALYSGKFSHGEYCIYCNRSVKMYSVNTTECCKHSAVLIALFNLQYFGK